MTTTNAPSDGAASEDLQPDGDVRPEAIGGGRLDTGPRDELAPPPRRSKGLGYQPALDGLRGLALLAIVVYHSELPGASGAFLSVSTFFTLSGFLITSIMLTELANTGTLSLRSFWARRTRRLLPAAMTFIAVILVAGIFLADATQIQRLAGDGIASLFYVANWRFIFSGQSYGAIFQSPSPFTHFWTLSIEEQFYLLFPVIVAVTVWVTRGSRRALATVFAVLAAASVLWSAWLLQSGASIDRMYFGTDTRFAELIAGGLLAIWWAGRTGQAAEPQASEPQVAEQPAAEQQAPRVRPYAVLGAVALIVMVVLWTTMHQDEPFFYRGGLALYSLVTLAVIVGCLQSRGPVRRLLGLRPLVWIGTVSYSAYLIHFPVIMWLDRKAGFTSEQRFAVGLPVTLLLAGLFTRLVERPIRIGHRLPGRRGLLAVPVMIAVVFALAVTASRIEVDDGSTIDFEAAAAQMNALAGKPLDTPMDQWTPEQREAFAYWLVEQDRLNASTAPRYAFFGDSTSLMTGLGVSDFAYRTDLKELAPSSGSSQLGCGLIEGVNRKTQGKEAPPNPLCDRYLDRWRTAVETGRIDIAVVQLGPWDVLDQQIPPGDEYLVVGRDRALDDLLERHLREAIAVLQTKIQTVVLLAPPPITSGMVDGRAPTTAFDESDPARMEAFRRIVRKVADSTPHVKVADLDGWMRSLPDAAHLRPDGIHFTAETTKEVGRWLGPELVRLYRQDGH